MISFRYHLVSIIAFFLALGLGVVVGTTALNGAVVGDLRRQVSDLKSTNSSDTARINALSGAATNADQLAQTFGSKIAGGTLAGVSVMLLAAPGSSADLNAAVGAEIAAAGGTVSGSATLNAALFDPARAGDVRALTTTGVHPIGLQLPQTDDAGALAGALAGYVLLGHGQPSDLTQVLAAFASLKMITASKPLAPAKVVVMLAPGGAPAADPATKEMLGFADELATIGGPTVVAGDNASAAQGGLVSLIRADSTSKAALTTVDDVSGALGQLTVALAVASAVSGHKGHFGSAAGADGLIPDSGR